jgi:GNAT superfamily N-acetyltransferase
MSAAFSIDPVRAAEDVAAAAHLFEAYQASLGIDLAYQDFAAELAGLPGKYTPPAGALLLARGADRTVLGCVALRPLTTEGRCEMKRLYVVPAGRGIGLGKALVNAIVGEARRIGYREMRLDTLPTMASALGLYRRAGFVPTEPYYDTPVEGTIFLALALA